MNLSAETLAKIDHLIPRYPTERSAVLPLCHLIQEEKGYISEEAMEWIAAKLKLQPINVYELVTFYPMLRQKPAGRKQVKVCRTLPCALRGAYKTCAILEEALQCKRGATSENNDYSIEFVECQADCGLGPVVIVNEALYENVDPEKAKQLADQIKASSDSDPLVCSKGTKQGETSMPKPA